MRKKGFDHRRYFIGGSDARIIMGEDEAALLRLWREKRGEVEPKDLSGNLIVQLGVVTEDLNRRWYEANTGQVITDIQRRIRHPILRWMGATLDGRVVRARPYSRPSSCCPGRSRKKRQYKIHAAAAAQYVGGGGAISRPVGDHRRRQMGRDHHPSDPLYQHLIVTAERKFWRCVENGEPPALFGVEPPRPRIEAVRIVDMSTSNGWAEFADIFIRTREAHLEHEKAKAELKSLMPEDAQQAIGHGIRAKRSKSGAISFDLVKVEGESHAAL